MSSLPPAATPNPETVKPETADSGTPEPKIAPPPDSALGAYWESLQALWPRLMPWAAAALAVLIGFGAGVVVTRHRHAAQENLAAVNGTLITREDLNGRMQVAVGQAVMHKLVEEELQLQFAKKRGVPPTDDEVEQRFRQISKDPRFLQTLNASGMGIGDYKHMLRVKLAQANVLTQGVTVSDAEVKQFYSLQSNPANPAAQFYKPETISLRVIQVLPGIYNGKPVSAQDRARGVEQELANNTPFELAASEFSSDESRSNGGAIQPLQRGRSPFSPDPALEAKIFSLKVGQVSEPILFKKSLWIFRCEDKIPGQAIPYETIQDQCRLGAAIVKGSKLNGQDVQKQFLAFQRASTLQAFAPQYQQAVTGRQ